ncbi:MAG: hypothetical protein R6W67_06780 [Bacteroidales bacterium]
MNRILSIIAFIILLLASQRSAAQFYDTGTDPASVRWSQIKSDKFRVIFPSPYRDEAFRTLFYLENAYGLMKNIYQQPVRSRRSNVIMHNYSTESNGYVSLAPNRMELYPMPGQNSTPTDQLLSLTYHETVHIMQTRALNRGFTRFMSLLTGESFSGIAAGLLPLWFYEGEAVLYESILTPGGRGNSPSFNKELKALYLQKPGGYNFNKILFGSYRDYTPDHYRYGLRMLEYTRAKYGEDLWSDAVRMTGSKPFLINPVNVSLRRSASLTKKKVYNETFSELSKLWNYEIELDMPVGYTAIRPYQPNIYVNYMSPIQIGADSIISIKTSYSEPPAIVLLTDNGTKEKRILYTGWSWPFYISYGAGKITWSELQYDPRWENRNYQVVAVHDLKSGATSRITRRSRYVAPAISSDGSMITAVESTPAGDNRLVLLEASSGEIIREIATPSNGYPQRPVWSEDNSAISVILLTDNGEGAFTYSIEEEKWSMILQPGRNDLQAAQMRNDTLFFISSAGGTDNLFFKTSDNNIYRITRSRFGIDGFSLYDDRIFFSDYNHTGFNIVFTAVEGDLYDYENAGTPASSLLGEISLPASDKGFPLLSGDSSETELIPEYEVKRYRRWQHILNIHSWMPFYFDIEKISADPASISPGVTLLTQNLLSTITGSFGYEYSGGDHKLHTGITWKGWYPVVDFRLSYGGGPGIFNAGQNVSPSEIFPAISTKTEISLPLRFSTGASSQYLRVSMDHYYENNYIYDPSQSVFDYGQSFFTGRLFFSNSRRSARRDIFPPLAQVLDIIHTEAPFDEETYGPITTIRIAYYLPGIVKNHGLRLRFQAEWQNPVRYYLGNRINFPRGYNDIISEKIESVSADYVFPIAYPDLSVGSLLYLKRIRGGLFGDLAQSTGTYYINDRRFVDEKQGFASFGGELLADFYVLRIPFEISAGARGGFVPAENRPFIEGVFSVDIFGFNLGNGRRERFPQISF